MATSEPSIVRDLCRSRLVLLLVAVGLLTGCSHAFFWPEPGHRWDPATAGIVYEDVWFRAEDGTLLHGWFLPATEARGTIVFLHGNAENVSTHIGAVHWLAQRGYNVFLPDYRGFGLSEGRPNFRGVHLDARAAFAYAAGREDGPENALVVLGQSLGGAVAITSVARHGQSYGVRALIADSAFSSYRGIAREKFSELWLTWLFQWPLSLTISDRYAPLDHVSSVSPIPLLLMAGEDDRIVPAHHSERLYRAALPPVELWLFEDLGHTQAFAREDVRDRFVAWLDEILGD